MTKEFQKKNTEGFACGPVGNSSFELRHYSIIIVSSFVTHLLTGAIRIYQLTVSPALAILFGANAGCRFTPSCSKFAMEAIQKHGALAGSFLAAKRICRCNPFGNCGHDPVPEKKSTIRHPQFI